MKNYSSLPYHPFQNKHKNKMNLNNSIGSEYSDDKSLTDKMKNLQTTKTSITLTQKNNHSPFKLNISGNLKNNGKY
jgi:hypothetical protein